MNKSAVACNDRNRFQASFGACSLLFFCLGVNAKHLLRVCPISVEDLLECVEELSDFVRMRAHTV